MGRGLRWAAGTATFLLLLAGTLSVAGREFRIEQDHFVKDGTPFQIISGGIHYFRIHPYYWEDRLLKMKAMGLNTAELYVAWNFHEGNPGEYKWDGWQDVEGFIRLAQKLDLLVILRPGPYICAEWDFGGLPAWLGSSMVSGGGTMKLRSTDPLYLAHVDRWWNQLLPRMAPLLYSNGGPIILIQIENEFGVIGPDETYMRHLLATAKNALGSEDVIFFTTDPTDAAAKGTLKGDEIYTAVDFGPTAFQNMSDPFGIQASLNADGLSPPFVSEFYSGWITRMGEDIQNPDFKAFIDTMGAILAYKNNSGSVNIYMAHGGTNFGWSIGAQEDGTGDNSVDYKAGMLESYMNYKPVLTSYDYDAPISEAGDYGQPGTGPANGGPSNKFLGIRNLIQNYTQQVLPPIPPRPRIGAYGEVTLTQQGTLLSQLSNLVTGPGIYSETPKPMEEYGQWNGLILYRTQVDPSELSSGATLFVGSKVRDSAVILADGAYVGSLERDGKLAVVLNEAADRASHSGANKVNLDILVMQMGRINWMIDWDLKGLVSGLVLLNNKPLTGWRVFPLPLDSLDGLQLPDVSDTPAAAPAATSASGLAARTRAHTAPAAVSLVAVDPRKGELAKELEKVARSGEFPAISAMVASDGGEACPVAPAGNNSTTAVPVPSPAADGPTFYRGYFNVNGSLANADGVLPDTYMNVGNYDWAKGVAFINGFNLGYYWPEIGPQNTMYIPGPLLKACNNEIVLLELGTRMTADASPKVLFTDQADFHGPPRPLPQGKLSLAG